LVVGKKIKKYRGPELEGDSIRVGSMIVTHVEDYGVIVRGVVEVERARKALKALGYKGVSRLPYRPCMVDQEASEWPRGLAVGGTPAVAFYFHPGPS
jgi:hypothetical protein